MNQVMQTAPRSERAVRKQFRINDPCVLRRCAVIAALAATLTVTACGGGVEVVVPAPPFDIGVLVAGQPISGLTIVPGVSQNITILAGQSIELDANEPVVWTLEVGGSAVTGSGTTVYYGGVAITQTVVSSSRIVVDTSAAFPLAVPVSITFVATSTLDSTLVATVTVLITT